MAYTSLETISSTFSRAVGNTAGLHTYKMIDESEINQSKNILYPCLILEVPNSSVLSINRAYEEYEMSAFVLYKYDSTKSSKEEILVYDQAIDKLEKVITDVIAQRNGNFIVEHDSFEIERIKNFGADKSIGIKCEFTLLAPSNLGYFTERGTEIANVVFPLRTGLMHLFHGAHNVVRTNSSLSWTSAINGSGFPAKAITPLKTSDVPEYSSPTFTISESNNEGMILDNVTFTSASFCVAFRISINHPNQTQEATILSIFESSSGDGFKFQVNSGQNTQGTALVQIDDDNDGNDEVGTGTNLLFNDVIPPDPNLNPLSECSLAIVNDAVNNTMTLKILASDSSTVQTYTIEGSSHSNQFIDAKIYFGCNEIRQGFDFPFKGMAGTISHIAIYDSALTPTDVDEVLLDIKEL